MERKFMFWILLGIFLIVVASGYIGYRIGWEKSSDRSWLICASVIELQKEKYKNCKVK